MKGIKEIDFNSSYFTIRKLAEGVYAAIERSGAGTGSNAGIIDLGDCTLVFDTFLNIDAAEDLKRASIEFTGREPQFVVISHFHIDHIVGNQVFASSTKIISSVKTREMMISQNSEYEGERDQYEARIKEIEELLKTENDHTKILNLKNELLFAGNLARPEIKLRMPDITIDNDISIFGSKREARVMLQGMAHTPGDLIIYLPEDKICFMGDMLFAKSHPWLGSGDPDCLVDKLQEILKLDIECFVPGHRDLGAREEVELEIQYVGEIKELVKSKLNQDNPSFSVEELPEVFRDWEGLCFMWNVNFLREKMAEK